MTGISKNLNVSLKRAGIALDYKWNITEGIEAVHRNAIDHGRLMRESTDRVESALHGGNPGEQLIASRLLESPVAFRRWESEHSDIMREVANQGFRRTQAVLLKKAAFRMIHRKALFEYLRDARIRGDQRRRVVALFHPTQDFSHALIAEHGLYLRKACSFLCTSHVGGRVVQDIGFFDPMQRYQTLYTEYFQIFCSVQLTAESAEGPVPQAALLPLLKYQLEECRAAIMSPHVHLERLQKDARARDATGDTVRLPILRGDF